MIYALAYTAHVPVDPCLPRIQLHFLAFPGSRNHAFANARARQSYSIRIVLADSFQLLCDKDQGSSSHQLGRDTNLRITAHRGSYHILGNKMMGRYMRYVTVVKRSFWLLLIFYHGCSKMQDTKSPGHGFELELDIQALDAALAPYRQPWYSSWKPGRRVGAP